MPDASDLITPAELAVILGKSYPAMIVWLRNNQEQLIGCGFKRGGRWEYSRKLLRERGVLREAANA